MDHDVVMRCLFENFPTSSIDNLFTKSKKCLFDKITNNKKILCIKGPQLVWFQKWVLQFSTAKIIWIYRNPGEVVESMLQLRLADKNEPQQSQPWLEIYEQTEGQYPMAKICGNNIEKCAQIWVKKNSLYKNYNPILIDYSDLCSKPEMIIKFVCDQVKLPFNNAMLHHNTISSDEYPVGHYEHKPIEINTRQVSNKVKNYVTCADKLYNELVNNSIYYHA